MAFITIISGSHEFRDDFGYFQKAFESRTRFRYNVDGCEFVKNRFDRIIISEKGEIILLPPIVAALGYTNYSITQTMGSGKTILGIEHLARIHKAGGNTAANLGVAWFADNQGKPKKEWVASINSLEEFQNSNRTTILFDDIKHTITRWNAEESEFISAIVNQSRKEQLNIIITTQRVINFVPPNIREVVTNYEIPYVTIRDKRKESPDGMGMPLEMEVLNISANGVFIGFGVFNGLTCEPVTIMPTLKLLSSYSTMEVAADLKTGMKKRGRPPSTAASRKISGIQDNEPYIGYNTERKVFEDLEKYAVMVTHTAAENPREHITDITVIANKKLYHIDAVGMSGLGAKRILHTNKKSLNVAHDKAKRLKATLLYAYPDDKEILYVSSDTIKEKRGNVSVTKELRKRSHSAAFYFPPRNGA